MNSQVIVSGVPSRREKKTGKPDRRLWEKVRLLRVDAEDTNEYLMQLFRSRHQGDPGLLQTLSVLLAEKSTMKKLPSTSILRRVYVTMPMDPETLRELFSTQSFAGH